MNQFKIERDMQRLVENNLGSVFGLELVRGSTKNAEMQLKGLRFDTLAFDKEANAFVIIEYKNGTNFSVIDQGYAYLSLLVNCRFQSRNKFH